MSLFEMVFSLFYAFLQRIICIGLLVVQRMKASFFCLRKLRRDASLSAMQHEKSNKEIFEDLKDDPEWGPFFRREKYDLEIHHDRRLGGGSQAEVFEAAGTLRGGSEILKLAVKIFKSGFSLGDLQTQWPRGLLKVSNQQDRPKVDNRNYRPCLPLGAMVLENDRFAFIFPRYEGDLRFLIDKLQEENNGPPLFTPYCTFSILHKIAKGMAMLHNLGFLHKDLKASNILYPPGEHKHCDASENIRDGLHIADFESSVNTGGTGFWRAPEILFQLQNSIPVQSLTFTRQADVWSYGMTCYEVLTGHSPFEGHSVRDYDLVIKGGRPTLPDVDAIPGIGDLVRSCWHEDPRERPSFESIIHELERIGPKCDHPHSGRQCEQRKKSNGCIGRSLIVEVEVKHEQKKHFRKESRALAALTSPRNIAMRELQKKKSIRRHKSMSRSRTEKATVHSFNFFALTRSLSQMEVESRELASY